MHLDDEVERQVHAEVKQVLLKALDECRDAVITPEALALPAYRVFDPDSAAPPLVQWFCLRTFKQMAEGLIASNFRYPVVRDGEEVYVLHERLTSAERRIVEAAMTAATDLPF